MEPENKNTPVPESTPEENPSNADDKTSESVPKPEAAEDTPTKEELAAFRKWQESQKSESEKQAAAISKANKAREEAETKAAAAELKFTALSKGVSAESLDDVIALAKTKVNDKITAEQAIDEIVKKYPSFARSSEPSITTGVRSGGNNTSSESVKAIDIIRAAQVQRK